MATNKPSGPYVLDTNTLSGKYLVAGMVFLIIGFFISFVTFSRLNREMNRFPGTVFLFWLGIFGMIVGAILITHRATLNSTTGVS